MFQALVYKSNCHAAATEVQLVIKISADEHFAATQKHVLTKLNEMLAHVLSRFRV